MGEELGPPHTLRRAQKLAESDSKQPKGVTPQRDNQGRQSELSEPDGHAATLEDTSGH